MHPGRSLNIFINSLMFLNNRILIGNKLRFDEYSAEFNNLDVIV